MKRLLNFICNIIFVMALIGGFNFALLSSGIQISLLASKIMSSIIMFLALSYTIWIGRNDN